jgi:hypothetical protein
MNRTPRLRKVKIAVTALAIALVVAGVLLLRELRRVPSSPAVASDKAEPSPLTDVAGPARRSLPPVAPAPEGELPPLPEVASVPPSRMADPSRPPQGTAPLAVSGAPVPPDPAVEPSLSQDPQRGGRTQ